MLTPTYCKISDSCAEVTLMAKEISERIIQHRHWKLLSKSPIITVNVAVK